MSASAMVMAATTALTVYIHHVARISSRIRSTAPPSNREIANEINTDVSGAIAMSVTTIDTTIRAEESLHKSSKPRKTKIASVSSAMKIATLKNSLCGAFFRAKISTGTVRGKRAITATSGDR